MSSRTGVGRFFVVGGLGMAVLGVIVLVGTAGAGLGEGGGITGGVFLMIGVIWALVGGGVGVYYSRVAARNAAENELFRTGARATGTIEGVEVTATEINECPVIELSVRVRPETGEEFVHNRRLAVPRSGIPLPGHLVEVAYDPSDHAKVALECDDRFSSPPARHIVTRPPGVAPAVAAPAPAAAAGPVADSPSEERLARLEKLAKLREDGILTPSEFEVEKAKILSGL